MRLQHILLEIRRDNKPLFSLFVNYDRGIDYYIRSIQDMKQKHENSSLEGTQNFEKQVVAYDESVVKEYLDKNTFDAQLSDKERELYEYSRSAISKSLDPKTLNNPILAALIERIARNSILLERFEKLIICVDGLDKEELQKKTMRGSSYITLLEEYRKCIETLVNIRWAYDTKKPQKTLARLREIVFEDTKGETA